MILVSRIIKDPGPVDLSSGQRGSGDLEHMRGPAIAPLDKISDFRFGAITSFVVPASFSTIDLLTLILPTNRHPGCYPKSFIGSP